MTFRVAAIAAPLLAILSLAPMDVARAEDFILIVPVRLTNLSVTDGLNSINIDCKVAPEPPTANYNGNLDAWIEINKIGEGVTILGYDAIKTGGFSGNVSVKFNASPGKS